MPVMRILRPGGGGDWISAKVFDDAFAHSLGQAISVREVDFRRWLNGILGKNPESPVDATVQRAFGAAVQGYDFLCPNYVGIPALPLLLFLRDGCAAAVRLLMIAHAPGAYPLEWALLPPLLRAGDIIVAPSKSARDAISFLNPALTPHIRVIPHPIRPPIRVHGRRKRIIASLSRLHPSKLLHRQIEAMAILTERGDSAAVMRIAGPTREPGSTEETPYARSLRAKIARLGLEGRVELVGEIRDPALKSRFLRNSCLLVNLSVTPEESFGKSAAEALGAGVPVLATAWDGLPETVGKAGDCIQVEATLVGVDVSAQSVADAMRRLLDRPPSPQVCRHQAARFHPRRVGNLYRRVLEDALRERSESAVRQMPSTDEAPSSSPPADTPDNLLPAAPISGLLSVTAPLASYSWQDLFALHAADVDRSRMAPAHPSQPTEVDQLRSLLIIGVQAPLSRRLAGLDLGGMDRSICSSSKEPAPDDFLERVARGARARATLSSRLACLSLLAEFGKVEELRTGLESLRETGMRSWAIEHLEIEALRAEGDFRRAFLTSLSVREPLYWGEMAAQRLHQISEVCRQWGRPRFALPYLEEWLHRFPDGPDSGPLTLDFCAGALAAGRYRDAERTLRSAQRLLGNGAEVKAIRDSMRRVRSLKRRLPSGRLTERVGAVESLTPIGRSTFRVVSDSGTFSLKKIVRRTDPARHFEILSRLAEPPHRFCPRPVAILKSNRRAWHGLFEWTQGRPFPSLDLDAPALRIALDLLASLADCEIVPEWRLEPIWLRLLKRHLRDHAPSVFMLDRLRRNPPKGRPTLAHGDFSLQNILLSREGALLLDWEEVGSAASGFDAGWMMALARLGVGGRHRRELCRLFQAVGFPRANLLWFERLGLLRLLYRSRTLDLPADTRMKVQSAVERAVRDCARRQGWRPEFPPPTGRRFAPASQESAPCPR